MRVGRRRVAVVATVLVALAAGTGVARAYYAPGAKDLAARRATSRSAPTASATSPASRPPTSPHANAARLPHRQLRLRPAGRSPARPRGHQSVRARQVRHRVQPALGANRVASRRSASSTRDAAPHDAGPGPLQDAHARVADPPRVARSSASTTVHRRPSRGASGRRRRPARRRSCRVVQDGTSYAAVLEAALTAGRAGGAPYAVRDLQSGRIVTGPRDQLSSADQGPQLDHRDRRSSSAVDAGVLDDRRSLDSDALVDADLNPDRRPHPRRLLLHVRRRPSTSEHVFLGGPVVLTCVALVRGSPSSRRRRRRRPVCCRRRARARDRHARLRVVPVREHRRGSMPCGRHGRGLPRSDAAASDCSRRPPAPRTSRRPRAPTVQRDDASGDRGHARVAARAARRTSRSRSIERAPRRLSTTTTNSPRASSRAADDAAARRLWPSWLCRSPARVAAHARLWAVRP